MLRKGDLSLKDCVFRSPGHISQPAHHYYRPEKYKSWTDQCFSKATDAVQNSVRRAAKEYDVPKSTLHDRLIGKVMVGGQSGQQKYLTDKEEEELNEFLVGCASVGFARSWQQVLELVQELVNRKGLNVRVSHGWWESFRRRHPELSLCTASPLSYARVVGSDPTIIAKYFNLLKCTLDNNELLDKPSQIFNLDEIGMPLDPSPRREASICNWVGG